MLNRLSLPLRLTEPASPNRHRSTSMMPHAALFLLCLPRFHFGASHSSRICSGVGYTPSQAVRLPAIASDR